MCEYKNLKKVLLFIYLVAERCNKIITSYHYNNVIPIIIFIGTVKWSNPLVQEVIKITTCGDNVTGDFNSRSLDWACLIRTQDSSIFSIWQPGWTSISLRWVSIFRRSGYGETIPDLSTTNDNIVTRISNWRIVEYDTTSDHLAILLKGNLAARNARDAPHLSYGQRCNFNSLDQDIYLMLLQA